MRARLVLLVGGLWALVMLGGAVGTIIGGPVLQARTFTRDREPILTEIDLRTRLTHRTIGQRWENSVAWTVEYRPGQGIRGNLYLYAADGDERFVDDVHAYSRYTWSATRDSLIYTDIVDGRLRAYRHDIDSGENTLVGNWILLSSESPARRWMSLLYRDFDDETLKLDVLALETGAVPQTVWHGERTADALPIAWADDERLGMFSAGPERTLRGLYLIDEDLNVQRFGEIEDWYLFPTFSPTGEHVVVPANTMGSATTAYVFGVPGGEVCHRHDDADFASERQNRQLWSSDGRTLALHNRSTLHALDVRTCTVTEVPEHSDTVEGYPAFSPDGAWLAYVARYADGRQSIVAWHPASGRTRLLAYEIVGLGRPLGWR